jgi:hypothetical protein
MIISIGIQCVNAELKKRINKVTPTLPFDWMLSHPKFIYIILTLLLENKINVEDIVNNHFFCCDKRATFKKVEFYYTDSNGRSLYNSKYDVIFPHDEYNDETKTKYIRRLERLKDLIINSNEKLTFIYSSQSSLNSGNFMIDDREIINNVYFYLTKIYELINMYNNNNEMIVFDSILNEDKSNLNEKIILYEMNSCNNLNELLNQILQKTYNIFD